jgi:hypothetical protein
MMASAAVASVMMALQVHLMLALPFLTLALQASALLVQGLLALGFLTSLLPVGGAVLRNHSFLKGGVWTGKIYMPFVFEGIEGLRTQILRKQGTR